MQKSVEIHLHLDGSLRPETVWELAAQQKIRIPAADPEELRYEMKVPEDCRNLQECLRRFDIPLKVLHEADALERVAYELTEDLANEGVTYAEIRFAPQQSMGHGLTQDQATEAVIRGVKRGMEQYPSIRIGLILCCMRGEDKETLNLETVETTKKYLGEVVCAVDLAGAESLYPTENFAPVFARAKEYGLPVTIHAGEAAGPQSIRTALSFGAKRIGHGISAIDDPELVQELVEKKITLEVCVTSNVQIKAVSSVKEHPIRRLFDAGVRVTVNSDNMTVSGTNVLKELALLREQLGFTDEELALLQEYAWEARFLR